MNLHKSFLLKLFKMGYKLDSKKPQYTLYKDAAELALTNYCNLRCGNCVSLMDIVQTDEYLSLEHVEKFVKESIDLKYNWEIIRMLGGEPTLHPFYFDVIKILDKYRKFNEDVDFEIITNGHGEKVQEIIKQIPPWVKIIRTVAGGFNKKFNQFRLHRVAPIDLDCFKDYDEFYKGCCLLQHCGIFISVWGKYYPSGVCATVDRVFELGIGEVTLDSLLTCDLKDKCNKSCRYCGYFLEPPLQFGTIAIQSESWDKALEEYLQGHYCIGRA